MDPELGKFICPFVSQIKKKNLSISQILCLEPKYIMQPCGVAETLSQCLLQKDLCISEVKRC